ncbi:MAG: Hsp70 family protein [Myxococcales bacterium]|nr:Hsp70 family protein [Myxococcales bacterium]
MVDRDSERGTKWALELTASDWSHVLQLTSSGVSRGGLFVRTAHGPLIGAHIDIKLRLPDGSTLEAGGEVVTRLDGSEAADFGTEEGFGVEFDEKHASDLWLLEAMASSQASGASTMHLDDQHYVTFAAVLHGSDGTQKMTAAHRPLAKSSEKAKEKVDLRAFSADAGSAIEVEIDLGEFGGQDSGPELELYPDTGLVKPGASEDGEDSEAAEAKSAEPEDGEGDVSARQTGETAFGREEAITGQNIKVDYSKSSETVTGDQIAIDIDFEAEAKRPSGINTTVDPDRPRGASGELVELSGEGHIFGIDFGTSYCSIAIVHGDEVTVLPDDEDQTQTPSVVLYPNRGRPEVGWEARLKQAMNRSSTFSSPKRLLGRGYDEPSVQPLIGQSGVQFARGPQDDLIANVWGEPISMPQVAAEIMRTMSDIGRKATGVRVEEVVLAAPVAFSERQRDALRRAARLAGWRLIAILDEPFAAAVAYGMTGVHDETVAVYDFGGGTFDFTLARIEDRRFSVLERGGDAWLGGDDFDLALADYVASIFERDTGIDLRKRQVEWQQLLFLCERAKRKLSTQRQAHIAAPRLAMSRTGPLGVDVAIDRQLFADVCGGLVDRSMVQVEQCMERARLKPSDIDQVVLTGGVSRIPMVRERLARYFGRPMELTVSPDHAIVVGTALYASYVRASR